MWNEVDTMEMVYEKVKLFRKQMEILIPEGFKDMPDYVARKKYPSKHRPPVILMDKNNICLLYTSQGKGGMRAGAETGRKAERQQYEKPSAGIFLCYRDCDTGR